MSDNFAFDQRVVDLYNQQRQHPADVSRQIGERIVAQIGGDKRVLEIGIGTGRIAGPVAEAGASVTGFDISDQMLEKIAPDHPFHLLQADMNTMPFKSGSFDAVMATHVLHLTKTVEQALGEAARTLRPDGVFIRGDDWTDPKSVVGQLRDSIRSQVIALAPHFKPPSADKSYEDILREHGATETTEHIAAEWTLHISPAERLETIAARIDPESWVLPLPLFEQVMVGLREHVAATWPDPDERLPVTRRFLLKVTRGQWGQVNA